MKINNFAVFMILGIISFLYAQNKFYKSYPANPDISIDLDNINGSLEIIGWQQNKVTISGLLEKNVKDLAVTAQRDKLGLKTILIDENVNEFTNARITLKVPIKSNLNIATTTASITVTDISGESIVINTLSGKINVLGQVTRITAKSISGKGKLTITSQSIDLRSMSGDIEVTGSGENFSYSSVSGSLYLSGKMKNIIGKTGSGTMKIQCTEIAQCDLHSTSGDMVFAGVLSPTGKLTMNSVSGNLEVQINNAIKACFDLSTRKGALMSFFHDNNITQINRRKTKDHKYFSFVSNALVSSKNGEANLSLHSINGNIVIKEKQLGINSESQESLGEQEESALAEQRAQEYEKMFIKADSLYEEFSQIKIFAELPVLYHGAEYQEALKMSREVLEAYNSIIEKSKNNIDSEVNAKEDSAFIDYDNYLKANYKAGIFYIHVGNKIMNEEFYDFKTLPKITLNRMNTEITARITSAMVHFKLAAKYFSNILKHKDVWSKLPINQEWIDNSGIKLSEITHHIGLFHERRMELEKHAPQYQSLLVNEMSPIMKILLQKQMLAIFEEAYIEYEKNVTQAELYNLDNEWIDKSREKLMNKKPPTFEED